MSIHVPETFCDRRRNLIPCSMARFTSICFSAGRGGGPAAGGADNAFDPVSPSKERSSTAPAGLRRDMAEAFLGCYASPIFPSCDLRTGPQGAAREIYGKLGSWP